MTRAGQAELVTSTKQSPRPEVKKPAVNLQVDVNWLFRSLKSDKAVPGFTVDRLAKQCKTPRRNEDVQQAYNHCERVAVFAKQVSSYLSGLFQVQTAAKKSLHIAALRGDDSIFSPVLPVMVQSSQAAIEDLGPSSEALILVEAVREEAQSNVQLTIQDSNRLLEEEVRTLKQKQNDLVEAFPEEGIATRAEAFAVVSLLHVARVCSSWGRCRWLRGGHAPKAVGCCHRQGSFPCRFCCIHEVFIIANSSTSHSCRNLSASLCAVLTCTARREQ